MPHKLPYREYLRTKLIVHAERTVNRLYPDPSPERQAFIDAIVAGKSKVPAFFWLDSKPEPSPFPTKRLTDWQPAWVEVEDFQHEHTRPSRHELYYQGALYPLDFSSVTTVSSLLAIQEPVHTILDVCSAPGGKAIFAWRLFHPETLICNEVIGKRHRSLHGNLERCGVTATVTQLDPKQLPSRFGQLCDLVMVDAPCSGQSLIARGEEAPGAFQDHLISSNMMRQRRILMHATDCVKPGGYLQYTTCTYSKEENEKNVEWLLRAFPQFKAVPVPHLAAHQSNLISEPCYRLEPHKGLGAGGFSVLFKNVG